MAKVKDYWDNWHRIVFKDRVVLRPDTKYMNWAQIGSMKNLDVAYVETDLDGTVTLVISQKS